MITDNELQYGFLKGGISPHVNVSFSHAGCFKYNREKHKYAQQVLT